MATVHLKFSHLKHFNLETGSHLIINYSLQSNFEGEV